MCRGFNSLPNHNPSPHTWLNGKTIRPSGTPVFQGVFQFVPFPCFTGTYGGGNQKKRLTFWVTRFGVALGDPPSSDI